MRIVIETLPVPEARVKYPPETEFAATNPSAYKGYFEGGIRYRDCSLEEVKTWKIGDPVVMRWGAHMIAHMLKPGPSEEELAKMSPGQKLAYFLSTAKYSVQETGFTMEKAIKKANQMAMEIPGHTGISRHISCILLSETEFRLQFLTDAELVTLQAILDRIRIHYQQVKAVTPNQKLINAITKAQDDIF